MPQDIPFMEAANQAEYVIRLGGTIHQKFTCGSCGSRQTIDQENRFYTHGKCEECEAVTDLRQKGCGFMVILNG